MLCHKNYIQIKKYIIKNKTQQKTHLMRNLTIYIYFIKLVHNSDLHRAEIYLDRTLDTELDFEYVELIQSSLFFLLFLK